MKVFYVMGGGMGHLYRVHTFIRQLQLTNFRILTANELAFTLFDTLHIIFINPDNYALAWKKFVDKTAPTLAITDLFIDTFPAGLQQEFVEWRPMNFQVHYLARRLKWDVYKEELTNFTLQFDTIYCIEELEEMHLQFIEQHARVIKPFTLNYPAPSNSENLDKIIPSEKPLWLVVHMHSREEVEYLLHYAQDVAMQQNQNPFFLVLSDQTIPVEHGMCMTYFPAVDWFPYADRIFVGGGFNIVQQIKPFLEKSKLIPFPRKYDDQVWRISNMLNELN